MKLVTLLYQKYAQSHERYALIRMPSVSSVVKCTPGIAAVLEATWLLPRSTKVLRNNVTYAYTD